MNIIKKFLLCLSLGFSTISFANTVSHTVFYGGLDAQSRYMPFKKGFGEKLFKERLPQGNLYIGIMLTDYLGLEGGYEATFKKTKPVTLGVGDVGLGFVLEPDMLEPGTSVEGHRFTSKLQGWHIDILGFTPPLLNIALEFFVGVGIAHKRIFLLDNIFSIDNIIQDPHISTRTFIERKTFPRLLVGVQKMFNEVFGMRVSMNWENTSRFKNLKPKERPTGITTASVKNNLTFGIGILIKY